MDEIPFVPWEEFYARFKWKQGEHMTLVGPTGQGKTTLALKLLAFRTYILVFVTKKKDPLLGELERAGYIRVKEWQGVPPGQGGPSKIVLAPPFDKDRPRTRTQQREFGEALDRVFEQGGWTVYMDEAVYITNNLKLAQEAELLWLQGRTLGVTMVAATQRPVNIPLVAYDQATHLFFWHDNDEANLSRISGLGGKSSLLIRRAVSELAFHEVLYLNTRTGEMVRTKARV